MTLFGLLSSVLWMAFCSQKEPVPSLAPQCFGSMRSNPLVLPLENAYDTLLVVEKAVFRIYQASVNPPETRFRILKQEGTAWLPNVDEEWTSAYEFNDWNQDGFVDLVLSYHHVHLILLYHPTMKQFVKFGYLGPDTDSVARIEGTRLLCHFQERRGSWNSELFEIDAAFHKKSYGIMEGTVEDSPIQVFKRVLVFNPALEDPNVEPVSRVEPNPKGFELLKSLPSDSLSLDWVQKYWVNNWRKFVAP
jgi:hypothetical protein